MALAIIGPHSGILIPLTNLLEIQHCSVMNLLQMALANVNILTTVTNLLEIQHVSFRVCSRMALAGIGLYSTILTPLSPPNATQSFENERVHFCPPAPNVTSGT